MSKEEHRDFFVWLEANIENKKCYYELKHLWVAGDIVASTAPANIDELYNSFRKQVKANRPRRVVILRNLQRIAAILILPLLGLWLWQSLRPVEPQQLKAEVCYSYYTPLGVKGVIMLPDSSRVWLNSGSNISFPPQFEEGVRTVNLSGEAFFEVKKDNQHPFIVMLPHDAQVRVYGTSFNVSCYPDDSDVQTTLVEGSLGVQSAMDAKELRLKPSENLSFDRQGKYIKKKVDVELYTSWKDGKLIFRNTPATEVLKKLERWFNIEFMLEDKDIEQFRFTATFDRENVAQVMALLKLSSPIDYTIKKDSVFIRKRY